MTRRVSALLSPSLALTAGFAVGCGGAPAPPGEDLRPVRTIEARLAGGERERSFAGKAEAGTESRLSFKVSGTVTTVAVEVGTRVDAGDLIAELDPRDYELAVQQAEAGLARARAELTAASNEYDRIRRLYENRNASKSQLDSARAAFESAQASVEAAEKQLEQAKLRLGYTRLTAPATGRIAAVPVDENENVRPGQPIATLTSGARPRVTVGIPEQLITRIEPGQTVEVRFDALSGAVFPAKVTEVGVAPLPGGATFPVTARLDDAAERVRPGMAATVTFHFEQTPAVGEDRRGRFVFVVEPLEPGVGIVRRREVSVGELTSGGMIVREGLSGGEAVVTAGISRIEDGMKVALPEEDDAP